MGNLFVKKQNKELTEEEKQKEEARKEELRKKRKEKQAQYDNYAKEQQDRETNDVVAKAAVSKESPDVNEKPAKNFVDNSTEGVANAKAGDWIKRNNGTEVQLTQADIDAAKSKVSPKASPKDKPVVETPKEEAPVEAAVEEVVEQTTEEPKEDDIPDNVKAELDSSDEGQQANAAVQANDPVALQNIVTPDGQAVLKGSFDANGNYVPYTYTVEDTRLVKNKGMAACLTIISIALASLGAAAGIPIVPINFMKFGASPQEDLERLQSVENDYAKLMNAGTAEAQTIDKTREAAQEANISDVEAYKNLSDADVQKAAQVNASVGGQNTQLDVQREAQEWEAKQKELDREFQKEMNNLNTDSQIAILKQQAINAQDLATLMNDLDVQKVFKKIEYGKAHGMSEDDVAKWIRAEQGTTKLMAGMKMGTDAANAAANIVGTFMPGGSDKNMKKFVYDGKAANSKMFNSKRKFW